MTSSPASAAERESCAAADAGPARAFDALRTDTAATAALAVTTTSPAVLGVLGVLSGGGVVLLGTLLARYTDAALPYWDTTTSVVSIAAIWLQAKKKIESWHAWLFVDVLATGIYVYKAIYFYALLYLFYIGMAVAGYLAWRKDLHSDAVSRPAPVIEQPSV